MNALLVLPEGLTELSFVALLIASFVASLITAALGIGGGALLLAIMAVLLPPAALIPVHGVVQLGSNAGRMALLMRHVHGPALPGFALGSVLGCALGGALVVELPPSVIQIGIGCFVIWSVMFRPPSWMGRISWLTGGISSFLTMFFGASGLFVASYTKSFALARHAHVATHGALMTVQHGLKVVIFGMLGFAFSTWAVTIVALILAGLAGTYVGRAVLNRLSDHTFGRGLDAVLVLLSLWLIWKGLTG